MELSDLYAFVVVVVLVLFLLVLRRRRLFDGFDGTDSGM
jgi:hypothetical protein